MAGATTSVKGVLTDFPTSILPRIDREPTREVLVKLHQLISGNAESVSSNLRGCRHGHLALTITIKDCAA